MSPKTFPIFKPAGDSALLVIFGEEIDLQINRRIHALDHLIARDPFPGLVETVPTYSSLLVYYDLLAQDYAGALAAVKMRMERLQDAQDQVIHRVDIPTCYGGEYGPDLDFVAEHNHLTPQEVIQIHSSGEYPVYMMGFTPGFPYLGGMDERIAAPRLESPRTHVPAGSVGIAGKQTGVYPIESPGGWRIIGRTDLKLFDPAAEIPFLLSPGDLVRFVPVSGEEVAHDDLA